MCVRIKVETTCEGGGSDIYGRVSGHARACEDLYEANREDRRVSAQ